MAVERYRKTGVTLGIFLVLSATLYSIAARHDNRWPISHYPMYSRLQNKHFTVPEVYGVTEKGEIRLHPDIYLAPFRRPRVLGMLTRLPEDRRPEALKLFWKQYDERRRLKLHDGPPLKAVRFYRAVWNVDIRQPSSIAEPVEKALVLEVKDY